MKSKLLLLSLLFLPFFASSDRISAGAAVWSLFDNQDLKAAHLVMEFDEITHLYGVRPTLLTVLPEGDNIYVALGLTKRISINDKWGWGFGSNIGFIDQSKDLGHKVEFYSRIFATYELPNRAALELELGHISNAGFGHINPGSESLVVSYSIAFD